MCAASCLLAPHCIKLMNQQAAAQHMKAIYFKECQRGLCGTTGAHASTYKGNVSFKVLLYPTHSHCNRDEPGGPIYNHLEWRGEMVERGSYGAVSKG